MQTEVTTPNDVGRCWPTILRLFPQGLKFDRFQISRNDPQPMTRNDIQQGVQMDAMNVASICTGLYVNCTLRETIMGCFYTNVILYNGNYKSNWHQLSL